MLRPIVPKLALVFATTLLVPIPQSHSEDFEVAAESSAFNTVENEHGITILEGIRPVLTYQRSVTSQHGRWPRANYLHPVYDLDGEVLTEDFPSDHGHHRGIFWAWHQVLVGERSAGDSWVCQDFLWDVQQLRTQVSEQTATIQTTVIWKSPDILDEQGHLLPIVQEQANITVYPAKLGSRWIDFEIVLTALRSEVKLGGSDDVKGYGGFSPRIKLSEDLVFTGVSGEVIPATTAVEAGPWINMANQGNGMAILCHPKNPSTPQPWILRRAKSMQNAVFPGREPVSLPEGQPLTLKYRLVIHRGNLGKDVLNEIYARYAED